MKCKKLQLPSKVYHDDFRYIESESGINFTARIQLTLLKKKILNYWSRYPWFLQVFKVNWWRQDPSKTSKVHQIYKFGNRPSTLVYHHPSPNHQLNSSTGNEINRYLKWIIVQTSSLSPSSSSSSSSSSSAAAAAGLVLAAADLPLATFFLAGDGTSSSSESSSCQMMKHHCKNLQSFDSES